MTKEKEWAAKHIGNMYDKQRFEISTIQKALQSETERTNNPLEKEPANGNRQHVEGGMQIVHENMKRCSMLLIINVDIATRRFHFHPSE